VLQEQKTSSKSVELYVGLWFPLGVNNILVLGEKLFEYHSKLNNGLKDNFFNYFRGSNQPSRLGNSILWDFRFSAYADNTDYLIQATLKWQGNGYIFCRGLVVARQDGESIEDIPANVLRQALQSMTSQVVHVVANCLLVHQNNYASHILFGEGLSTVLNNFDPDSIHVDEVIRAKITTLRMEEAGTGADKKQVLTGFEYLTHQILVFRGLGNRVLCPYHEDFQNDETYQKQLPEKALYRKGRFGPAYNLSINGMEQKIDPRYRERRGAIALDSSVVTDELINLLICLNSGIQFVNLVAFELSNVRKDVMKARKWLVRKDEFDEIMADYVVFLESKLPVVNELIDFAEYDLKPYICTLNDKCKDSIKNLAGEDIHLSSYPLLFDSSLATIQRLRKGLKEEIFALNEYINTEIQQHSVRIAHEAQVASTRSLDTQTTLAEFQRTGIQKGIRTKWLGALTVSSVIATTGVWSKVADIFWNLLVSLYIRATGILGVQLATQPPSTIPSILNNVVQAIGVIGGALLLGRLILYIERGIPDIVQASFDLEPIIELEVIERFLSAKNIISYRGANTRIKVSWSEKNPVWLNLDKGDWKKPSNILEKFLFKVKFYLAVRHSNLKRVMKRCVCSLEYDAISTKNVVSFGESKKAKLQNLSITVDRDSQEVSEAYIHPIHLRAANILQDLLHGSSDKEEKIIEYILTVTNASVVEKYNRGTTTIAKDISSDLIKAA